MHSFTTFTVATACLTALTAAVPHARRHYQLHPVRNAADLEPQVVKLAPIAGRQVPGTLNLSPIGECGGSSGFGCGEGFCCSKWGYCGTTDDYCGDGSSSSNSTGKAITGGGHGGYPGSGHPHGPPGGSWGPPGGASSAAPAPSGAAPSGAAPFGYGSPSAAPSSAPASAPSSAPAAPPASSPAVSAPIASMTSSPPASSAPAYSAPAPSASSSGGSPGGSFSGYKMYTGSGAPSSGWPEMSQWMEFDAAWEASVPNMKASCAQWDVADNSDTEISEIKSAIQSASSTYGVDSRFILAIMMQESNGCVRVHTTNNGVINPGLFQSHDGTGSCNNGQVLDPCPDSEIKQMVDDGVGGTSAGDGLKQTLASCHSTGAQAYYQAAVIYNSGNLPSNLDDNTATPCYASDVANRLMGWTQGTGGCTLT